MLRLEGDTLTTGTEALTTQDALPRSSSSALWMASTSPSSWTAGHEPGHRGDHYRSLGPRCVRARGPLSGQPDGVGSELELTAGQSVVISLEAGRSLDVQGNAGVWRSGGRER